MHMKQCSQCIENFFLKALRKDSQRVETDRPSKANKKYIKQRMFI